MTASRLFGTAAEDLRTYNCNTLSNEFNGISFCSLIFQEIKSGPTVGNLSGFESHGSVEISLSSTAALAAAAAGVRLADLSLFFFLLFA